MRTKTTSISERSLMFVIAGQLFDQAPNRQPRKAEIIMQKVKEAFRKDAYNDNEWYCLEIPESDTYKYINDLLMAIPEFVELNLSQVEFEKNVAVDDESRPKFAFTSRYDKETPESWKHDFIDLDAFIRNVHSRLLWLMNSEQDCFLCIHQGQTGSTLSPGNSEKCKTCTVNPDLKCHYESGRKPKGKYTFACKFDCHEHKYICCEECDKNGSCTNRCDGISETCGNKVME
jgi:hypothetical protein